MRREHIFFDLGWTLEDETDAQIRRAEGAAVAAAEFGIETSPERILELQEEGAAGLVPSVFHYALRELGLSKNLVAVVAKRANWDKSLLSLYPEARNVLEQLSEHHFLGLIANQSPGTERRLRKYGIAHYFGVILPSAELGMSKPDPAIFDYALGAAGCSPSQAWMVGDRLDNDIRPANAAGWRTIRVLKGYNAEQQPREELESPDYTITSLDEIPQIVADSHR